jgi:hypothetical protein
VPPLVPGVDANYKEASEIIEDAPDESQIFMTSLRKSDTTWDAMREYSAIRDRRICEGKNIAIRRVFVVCNETDVTLLEEHLKRLNEGTRGKGYDLRILRGTERTARGHPYFDMLLVKDKKALLQIPFEKGAADEQRSAMRVTDKGTLEILFRYFDDLWSEATEFKRADEEIDEEFLATWRERLEGIPVHEWFAPLHS